MVAGELAPVNAGKVLTACDGLDDAACTAVEAVLADRLVGMDPARITTVARRVATRIAADQVAAAQRKNRKDRLVQVTPGPDGSTDWWARLPAARSAAAWAAVRELGDQYARNDPDLTLDQARADALMDLLLTNVNVTATVTLGIPILTGPDARHRPRRRHDRAHHREPAHECRRTCRGDGRQADRRQQPPRPTSADVTRRPADSPTEAHAPAAVDNGPAGDQTCDADWVRPAFATGGLDTGGSFSISAALISGCEIPGIGWIDAETVENLLSVVPTDIARALLDARTGTLMESMSAAYRPPKTLTEFVTTRDGTCRMWGCTRPTRRCDIDHATPWPNGPTTHQPRRALPPPPPPQTTPPLGLPPRPRRHRHLDLTQRHHTHHPTRPRGAPTPDAVSTGARGRRTACVLVDDLPPF